MAAVVAFGFEREWEMPWHAVEFKLGGIECDQCIEQAGHRAFAHRRVAVECVSAASLQCEKGGEEARGGAGVADVQLCRAVGNAATFTFNRDGCGGLVGRALKA